MNEPKTSLRIIFFVNCLSTTGSNFPLPTMRFCKRSHERKNVPNQFFLCTTSIIRYCIWYDKNKLFCSSFLFGHKVNGISCWLPIWREEFEHNFFSLFPSNLVSKPLYSQCSVKMASAFVEWRKTTWEWQAFVRELNGNPCLPNVKEWEDDKKSNCGLLV